MTNYDKIKTGEIAKPKSAELLGADIISYCPEELTIRVEFSVGEQFTNPSGNIQGGFLCAMLDECLGPVLMFSLNVGQFAPTLELKTQFLRAAKVGRIEGTAKVVSKGRQVCYLEGELFQDGKLISRATATALIQSN